MLRSAHRNAASNSATNSSRVGLTPEQNRELMLKHLALGCAERASRIAGQQQSQSKSLYYRSLEAALAANKGRQREPQTAQDAPGRTEGAAPKNFTVDDEVEAAEVISRPPPMSTTRGRKRLTPLLHPAKSLKLDLPCLVRPAAFLRRDHPTTGNDAALGSRHLGYEYSLLVLIGLGRDLPLMELKCPTPVVLGKTPARTQAWTPPYSSSSFCLFLFSAVAGMAADVGTRRSARIPQRQYL
jgi:hypothetical protein